MVWDLKESLIVSRLTISIDMHGCLLMTDKQPGIHRKKIVVLICLFSCMAVGSTKKQHHSFVKDMAWDKKNQAGKKNIRFCRVNLEPTGIHAVGTWRSRINSITSWWFQPIWKICSSNWESSPSRGDHRKIFETNTSITKETAYTFFLAIILTDRDNSKIQKPLYVLGLKTPI